MVDGMHAQFRARYGEPGYSARQLSLMSEELGIRRRYNEFLEAFKKSGLAVDLRKEGFRYTGRNLGYLISSSKLDELVRFMRLPTSRSDLEDAAERLNIIY